MTADDAVLYLSIMVAILGVVAAFFGARAGTPMPHDKITWNGVSPFEIAFRKARKWDGFFVTGLTILAAACGIAIAVLSRSGPN